MIGTIAFWTVVGLYLVWRIWRGLLEREMARNFAASGFRLQKAPGPLAFFLRAPTGIRRPIALRRWYALWPPSEGQLPWEGTWPELVVLHRAFREEKAKAADEPPWKVQEGSNEVEGFFVVGYGPDPALPNIPHAPHPYGPYATLEDARAVVAPKDPTVRPLSEELLKKEQEEMMKWREEQSGEKPSGGLPPTGRDD